MIYLPHPTFNFEKSGPASGDLDGGGLGVCHCRIGCINPVRPGGRQYSFDVNKLNLNFEKYRTYYWNSHSAFGFLCEDGMEIAIRIINNNQVDIWGYWRPFNKESYHEGREFVDSLLKHIEFCCPVSK